MSAASITIKVSETLFTIDCCSCHVLFAIPDTMDEKLRESHRTFYCPNGHTMSYQGKTEAEKLKDQLAKERAQREAADTRAKFWRDEKEKTDRRLSAAKGQATRLRKRTAGGVCPCCNRTFVELARHMHTKHPDYAEE